MKHVVISLLNFNGTTNTLDCLKSLKNIKKDNLRLTIVVVDNASTDGSSPAISEFKSHLSPAGKISNLKFIQNEKNLGFSGGHNVAIRYALKNGADYIIILNNDTYVHENFLIELLKVAKDNDESGILSPKIYFAPGFEYHKERYSKNDLGKVLWYAGGKMDWANVIAHHRGVDEVDVGQFDRTEQTELATGCCMLIKREVLDKIGVLDDRYFLYYEDADLCMRAKNKGYKILYAPKSVMWHKNAGSTGGSGSVLQDYYITRNRLLFGFNFSPIRSKFALFRESLFLLFSGRKWQKKGVLDFYLRNLGKGNYQI